jgi:Clathrin adaptor complex small chain
VTLYDSLLAKGLLTKMLPSCQQLESVHFLVDEMVQNGFVVETNKQNILRPIALMERESQKAESMFR